MKIYIYFKWRQIKNEKEKKEEERNERTISGGMDSALNEQ